MSVLAAAPTADQRTEVPLEFYLPSAAADVLFRSDAKGEAVLRYRVSEVYPAVQTTNGIVRSLREHGYKRLGHDFLNPQNVLEEMRPWSKYIDGTLPEEPCVREYLDDWIDQSGTIARYMLRYQAPCSSSEPSGLERADTLEVSLIRAPAADVRRLQQGARSESSK